MITELDVDVLPRDPGMYGADLEKRAKFRAETNLYPDGLPKDKQEQLARRYADIFALFLKHRDEDRARHVLGRDRRPELAQRLPGPGPRQLSRCSSTAGPAEAGLRRGGRGPEEEADEQPRTLPATRTRASLRASAPHDLLARMTLEEKVAQMLCVWQQKPHDARRREGRVRRGEGAGRASPTATASGRSDGPATRAAAARPGRWPS